MKNYLTTAAGFLAVVIVLGMTGCENHVHTYEEKWSTDSVYHWHKATCEHTEEISDYGEHDF